MDWILNHWWVATSVPYFAFNVWFQRVFDKESGPGPTTWTWKITVWTVGLWIVLGVFFWALGEMLLPILDPRKWMRRPKWANVRLLKRIARASIMAIGLMFLYVFAVAATSHRPIVGEVWTMWLLATAVGTLASR